MKTARNLLMLALVFILTVGFSGLTSAASDKKSAAKDAVSPFALDFKDIEDANWASAYIAKMKSKNVLQGFEDGSFRPNQPVTRVEAIVMAVRLLGLEDQAKAQKPDAKLFFKDAEQINKKYPWAKGYILTALENGLFDASEQSVQPEKPASRVWIAGLLVKSLGLQQEALHEMNKTPSFKDAASIPAGSIGYVNVAVEKGIIGGYPDGTFKPNKSVTRAEIAALLDRTGGGLLDQAGAVKASGVIQNIEFKKTAEGTSPSTVSGSVYGSVDGSVTIATYDNKSLTYGISSELLVTYHNKYVRADQLAVNDSVQLTVLDNIVREAVLLDSKPDEGAKDPATNPGNSSKATVVELDLEIKLGGQGEVNVEYKNKKGKIEAEFELKSGQMKQKLEGKAAAAAIEKLIGDAAIAEETTAEEAVSKLVSALKLNNDDIQKLELSVKFSNGKEIKIEKKQSEKNLSKGKDKENDQGRGNEKGHGNEKGRGNGKK
ncbi:S-layer homology domain-containing protein [Paenibacillus sp. VCA1]|uniref:S-layer homology domain-containing protein n=1 Tax=Paenibacillus sp. VCA1 TaxID=3039148 RepID=UPI0028713A03|nr:S-layer homology domain-containing protein [Paenibacillus sp. VCA1]MDR9856076.1 S-layer homology domain-containing protein [Paenibacillus sp. VCA1]